jgi:hypothetical protein
MTNYREILRLRSLGLSNSHMSSTDCALVPSCGFRRLYVWQVIVILSCLPAVVLFEPPKSTQKAAKGGQDELHVQNRIATQRSGCDSERTHDGAQSVRMTSLVGHLDLTFKTSQSTVARGSYPSPVLGVWGDSKGGRSRPAFQNRNEAQRSGFVSILDMWAAYSGISSTDLVAKHPCKNLAVMI